MSTDDLLLAPSTRLVHIGPFKTGTTALQNAFHACRAQMSAHGVHYAGEDTQPTFAALSVTGTRGRKGDRLPTDEDWSQLTTEVREAGDQRVVISSEFFSAASSSAARRVVSEISGGPVHVVITLRSIAKIAPSQWQQYVQNGLRISFTSWLEAVLADPPDPTMTPTFWQRHDHAELVRRWTDVVGPENVTVVVIDEHDRSMTLRTFESFVGLPPGLLQTPDGAANRSLTAAESDVVRLINQHFYDHDWSGTWNDETYGRYVRDGAVRRMRTQHRPGPDEPRLALPHWALQRSSQIGAGVVQTLRSSGVRIVGDPSALCPDVPSDGAEHDETGRVHHVPAMAAVHAVLGAMTGKRGARSGEKLAAALAANAAFPALGDQDLAAAWVPCADAAAAVVGAIEGRADLTQLAGLPPISAESAMSAAVAGTQRVQSHDDDVKPVDPQTVTRVAQLLGVETADDKPTPLPQKVVSDVTARELLTVVLERGTRRLRKMLAASADRNGR